MMVAGKSFFCRALRSRTALVFVLMIGFGATALAAAGGAITGTVSDPAGTGVSDAIVTAVNTTSGASAKTTTNAAGFYSFQDLPKGNYDLSIAVAGLKPSQPKGIVLEPETKIVANITLEPPEPSEPSVQAQGQKPAPSMPNMPMPAGAQQPAATEPEACNTESTDPKALLNCIRVLEQRINDLESNTVLSEPQTRVRQIEVYVDSAGNVSDTPKDGTRKVTTYQRERVYRRQTINEKIEEALEDASKRSIQVGVDASIVAQFVQQTKGEKEAADGHAYQLANADLFFTAGIAQNTMFFADVVGLSGPPPDLEVPSLTLLNGYSARLIRQNELNLREAWLRTEIFSQKLAITAGRLDLTNYFDHNGAANDETTQFISDGLVNNPMLGLATNGPGVSLVFDPKKRINFKIGFQQSKTEATSLSESIYSLAEIGYLMTPFSLGEGNYRVWYRTDNSSDRYRTGYGLSFDQKLSSRVTLFGRYGAAQADVRRDHFYSGGLQFSNGLGFYPGDTWGLGYAHLDQVTGEKERLTEGYYNLALTERLRLSFHGQHVLETKPGIPNKLGFFVSGVRLQASF
jgi:hypothetical protein